MICFPSGKNRLIVLCLLLILSFKCFPIPGKPLLLDAVLKSVDRSYPQIVIARLEIRKAEGDYVNALGKFDPSFDVNPRFQPVGGILIIMQIIFLMCPPSIMDLNCLEAIVLVEVIGQFTIKIT